MPFEIALEGMQAKSGGTHVLRVLGGIEHGQHDLQASGVGGLDAGLLACPEKQLQSLVQERLDHVVIVTHWVTRVQTRDSTPDARGSEGCQHRQFVFVYRRERTKNLDLAPAMEYRRIETMNNTAWQRARELVGLSKVRVHDLRHTFGQRLRDAGVSEEDRALLLGHAIEGMPQHYATATVARLVEAANSVRHTVDRTTLLRVVNG